MLCFLFVRAIHSCLPSLSTYCSGACSFSSYPPHCFSQFLSLPIDGIIFSLLFTPSLWHVLGESSESHTHSHLLYPTLPLQLLLSLVSVLSRAREHCFHICLSNSVSFRSFIRHTAIVLILSLSHFSECLVSVNSHSPKPLDSSPLFFSCLVIACVSPKRDETQIGRRENEDEQPEETEEEAEEAKQTRQSIPEK